MKQKYYPYYEWEDFLNGMYNTSLHSENSVSNSIIVLSNSDLFDLILNEVINNWKISSDQNLSNKYCNRQAWLGQSACSYYYKSPEISTRVAWATLTNKQRYYANKVANKWIRIYENKNKQFYKGMGKQGVFKWDS